MAASTSSACCFSHQYIHGSHHQPFNQAPGDPESGLSSSSSSSMAVDENLSSLLSSASVLKNKVNEVQSTVTSVFIHQPHFPPSETLAGLESLIQEIAVTASSMLFHCQQMAIKPPPSTATVTTTTGNNPLLPVAYTNYDDMQQDQSVQSYNSNSFKKAVGNTIDPCNGLEREHVGNFVTNEGLYWYTGNNDTYNHNNNNNNNENGDDVIFVGKVEGENRDIIEINAADLLAKYTHYCQVCGKGFKRDANLRMHMRAHGDEYKSSAALSNPAKNSSSIDGTGTKRYYSCPQEGCRWNKKHAKFQPLKSMICAKNHYKRSHCPKLYICKRCNIKQFAVLSDLRTHEKHCGDLKWQCSRGTTFSRKDKLMGHVTLFVGHTAMVAPTGAIGRGHV